MLGCADAMPNAAQTVDRSHVMQLFTRALDRVRAAEARSGAEKRRLHKRTRYIWLKRPESLTEGQATGRASLERETSRPRGPAR